MTDIAIRLASRDLVPTFVALAGVLTGAMLGLWTVVAGL
jgi:hypothetical protein